MLLPGHQMERLWLVPSPCRCDVAAGMGIFSPARWAVARPAAMERAPRSVLNRNCICQGSRGPGWPSFLSHSLFLSLSFLFSFSFSLSLVDNSACSEL